MLRQPNASSPKDHGFCNHLLHKEVRSVWTEDLCKIFNQDLHQSRDLENCYVMFLFFEKWEPLCCSSGPSCKPGLSSRGCLVPRRLRDWTRSSCSPEISLSMFLWLDGSTLVIVIHQSNFSCATHVIKESPSHWRLPSSDLEKIELLPILEAEHTPELHNGAS